MGRRRPGELSPFVPLLEPQPPGWQDLPPSVISDSLPPQAGTSLINEEKGLSPVQPDLGAAAASASLSVSREDTPTPTPTAAAG